MRTSEATVPCVGPTVVRRWSIFVVHCHSCDNMRCWHLAPISHRTVHNRGPFWHPLRHDGTTDTLTDGMIDGDELGTRVTLWISTPFAVITIFCPKLYYLSLQLKRREINKEFWHCFHFPFHHFRVCQIFCRFDFIIPCDQQYLDAAWSIIQDNSFIINIFNQMMSEFNH